MDEWQLAIGAGLLLSFIHLIGPRIEKFVHGKYVQITSLSAGMFLSYIFLDAFEAIAEAHTVLGKTILLFFFLGFALYHVFNKYLYQHAKSRKEREEGVEELLYAGSIIDSMFTGFALAIILDINQLVYFALIPFLLHTVSATIAFQLHHKRFRTPKLMQAAFAFSPLMGALVGQIILFETGAFYRLLAFVTGAVLYIAVRHMLPGGRKGDLKYFMAGALIGIILLIL